MSIRLKVAAVGVAVALSPLAASAAQAATVTLGSPLTNALPSSEIAISATVRQTALPGATLVAPFNGQIRSLEGHQRIGWLDASGPSPIWRRVRQHGVDTR